MNATNGDCAAVRKENPEFVTAGLAYALSGGGTVEVEWGTLIGLISSALAGQLPEVLGHSRDRAVEEAEAAVVASFKVRFAEQIEAAAAARGDR